MPFTPQQAYDFHRARAYRDPDDPLDGVIWDDPLEAVAIAMLAVGFETPDGAWSLVSSAKGRTALDKTWCFHSPADRQLYRRRAGVVLLAAGVVTEHTMQDPDADETEELQAA
jgi:hypothetical protein